MNKELYNGLVLPDNIWLHSQCFDVHGQIIRDNVPSFVNKDYYTIPITVRQLQWDTYEFPDEIVFENWLSSGTTYIEFYFTDSQDWWIYFNSQNAPEFMCLFERVEKHA